MLKRDDKARERRLEALAAGETNVHERLLQMRNELDAIVQAIDRLTLPRRPRMHADSLGLLPDLNNLLPFRKGRLL